MNKIIAFIKGLTWKRIRGPLYVVLPLIGAALFLILSPNPKPHDPAQDIVNMMVDSLKRDIKDLQAEQEGYRRSSIAIRTELNSLTTERAINRAEIAKYQTELTTLKNQYAKISDRYRGLSADSTRILFLRAFGY